MNDAALSHVGRLKPAMPSRDAMINDLADNFHVDEQSVLVENGPSTELILFPSELQDAKSRVLEKRIGNVVTYPIGFSDVHELNALQFMPEDEPNYYLTLGLYLYFADVCSHVRPDTTFLTAMREAGAGLAPDDAGWQRVNLYQKTKKALQNLGMPQACFNALEDWYTLGTYTIENEPHSSDISGKKLRGCYAELARNIELRQGPLGLNLAISYALGNKAPIQALAGAKHSHMNDSHYALERTKALLDPFAPVDTIERLIEDGDEIRRQRLRQKIEDLRRQRSSDPESQRTETHAMEMAKIKGKNIFSRMPGEALELFYREGYVFGYENSPDIRGVYPAKDLPGLTHDYSESSRKGMGLRQGRYHIIYLAGSAGSPANEAEARQRDAQAAQTLLHECMHMATGYLGRDEMRPVMRAVKNVHEELEALRNTGELPPVLARKLTTLTRRTLAEALDFGNDKLYDRREYKSPSDTRREEALCNFYGFLYTEPCFLDHGPSDMSPESPYARLKTLVPLVKLIEETMQKAVARSREKFPDSAEPARDWAMGK